MKKMKFHLLMKVGYEISKAFIGGPCNPVILISNGCNSMIPILNLATVKNKLCKGILGRGENGAKTAREQGALLQNIQGSGSKRN